MNFDSKTLNALAVNLHGRRIGVINRISGDRYLYSFEDSYIEDANHPTLSLSFKGQAGGLVIPTRAVTGRLPAFFSNLLPEGHLREYLAAQAGVQSHREFFLLAALGADLPGALTITPMEPPTEASSESADNHPTRERFQEGAAFRFSLAGVQLKFSAIMETASGLTIPAGGVGGSWIVKLPSNQFASVPESEYTMLALARAVGIEVPRTELIDVSEIHGLPADAGTMEGNALAVQRFDRGTAGEAIHMEDFAQVFGLYPQDLRILPPTGLLGAYRQRRHAPEELVASLSGSAHAGVVAGLRFRRYGAIHSERQPRAHFWRQPQHERNHP